jgi:hypothetical protein
MLLDGPVAFMNIMTILSAALVCNGCNVNILAAGYHGYRISEVALPSLQTQKFMLPLCCYSDFRATVSTTAWKHVGKWSYNSTILSLGTRWRWVVSFTALPLCPPGKNPGMHWVGGWTSPRGDLDVMEGRKFSCPCQESNPDTLVTQFVVYSLHRLKYTG